MKKARIYNFLIILVILNLLSVPLVLQQTTKFMPVFSIILLCLMVAFYMERSVTFRIMSFVDKLKWINDEGVGGISIFLKFIIGIFIIAFIVLAFQDINQFSILPFAGLIYIPFLIQINNVYIGENFIYTQGSYIKISDIISYEEKEVKKGYRQVIIKANKGTYCLHFRGRTMKGIDILEERLSTS